MALETSIEAHNPSLAQEMVQLGPAISIITGIVVAIISVILTVYTQNRFRRLKLLYGLKSEIERNREKVVELGIDLADNIVSRETGMDKMSPRYRDPDITSTSIKFDTSAYDEMKNNGYLSTLDNGKRKIVQKHYRNLNLINEELNDRESIRANGKSWDNKRYNEMILRHERSSLRNLLKTCSEELFLEMLDQSTIGEQRLIGFKQGREINLNDTEDFDTLLKIIDTEINGSVLNFLIRSS